MRNRIFTIMAGLGLLGAVTGTAQAAPSPFVPYYQNLSFTSDVAIKSGLIGYDYADDSQSIVRPFTVAQGFDTIRDPFVNKSVANQLYFIGVAVPNVVSTLVAVDDGPPSGVSIFEENAHLVLALNDAFSVQAQGVEFEAVFDREDTEGFDFIEQDLIDALNRLAEPDLDKADEGYAAQQAAKNAAVSLLFGFGERVYELDAGFGNVDTFTLTAFSAGVAAGVGGSTTSLVAGPPSVPEPATWGMMLLGFGLAGMALRRRAMPAIA